MQLGAVHLFDGGGAEDAPDFAAFREHLSQRLQLWPRLRQRIVEVPLNVACPYWLDDPDFYLDHHLSRATLNAPRSQQSLMTLAADLFSRPLDRRRALWSITYVEGLSRLGGLGAGSFALITRVHQAMASDLGIDDMLLRITGSSPTHTPPPRRAWRPEPVPSDAQMLAKAYGKAFSNPVELARLVARGAMVAAQVVKEGTARRRELPPHIYAAPPTRWNQAVTPARRMAVARVPLSNLCAIRKRVGDAQINDVVVALCSGALRDLLASGDALPVQPLVGLCPVLSRVDDKPAALPMMLPLATDVDDPAARLHGISAAAAKSGLYRGAETLEEISGRAPMTLAVEGIRLYTGLHLADRFRPMFNLVCLYMPSTGEPRYLMGARLKSRYFALPLLDGQGLTMTASSCDDQMDLTVLACPDCVPGLDRWPAAVQRALRALTRVFD